MNDIYDIKNTIIGLPINILYSSIYIILVIIIYYISKYWKKQGSNEDKNIISSPKIIEEKIDYAKILKEIENNIELYPSNIFYSKISNLLKTFIENEQGEKVSTKTLQELDLNRLSGKTGNLIKNIYYKIYKHNSEDNLENKQNIIDSIKEIIGKD